MPVIRQLNKNTFVIEFENETTVVSFKVPRVFLERIDTCAKALKMNRSEFIRLALKEAVEKVERELGITTWKKID